MIEQAVLWISTIAILALAAVAYREARILRGLYKNPKHMESVD